MTLKPGTVRGQTWGVRALTRGKMTLKPGTVRGQTWGVRALTTIRNAIGIGGVRAQTRGKHDAETRNRQRSDMGRQSSDQRETGR